MKEKLLYIMHVPWGWIKQRPHFLAESFNEYFDITVLYPETFRHNKKLLKNENHAFIEPFKTLPFQRFQNIYLYKVISDHFINRQINLHIKNSKYIWITQPFFFNVIKKNICSSQIVIFDCMDDFMEFSPIKKNSKLSRSYFMAENDLINRADFIFASSKYLKEKLQFRYHLNKEIYVINNALSNVLLSSKNIQVKINYPEKNGFVDFLYIGTISQWFNFKLVIKSLKHFKNIRFILIGPTETAIPKHKCIIYLGTKMHYELNSYMSKADALVMPFYVNDLIKSVNPVKLYEYIYSGKPIITCNYDEIDQFDKYVYRYDTEEEFINLIQKLLENKLAVKLRKDRISFLLKNTWQERTKEILEILQPIGR